MLLRVVLRILLMAFHLGIPAISVASQSHDFQEKLQILSDNYLKQYAHIEDISAISISIKSPATTGVITITSGHPSLEEGRSLTSSDLFQIGSITKSFISVILLQLESDPKYHFDINDKLSKYLPQYPKWGNVTIKQLLNMTSGIPSYTRTKQFAKRYLNNPFQEMLPEELIKYVYNQPRLKNGFHYSNTNYILAGMVISKLTGHSIQEEVQQRFIGKNSAFSHNLSNTYYISHLSTALLSKQIIHGFYNKHGNLPRNLDVTYHTLSWAGASGALVSSTEDVVHWVQALFTSHLLSTKQFQELTSLVSVKTGKSIKMPTQNEAGFGLGIGLSYDPDYPDDLVYSYEGETLGYRAFYIHVPTKDITIAIAVNSAVEDDNNHLLLLMKKAYRLTREANKN